MGRLTGRIAVVSGASRGAGRGIALSLGEAGATVYVTGRSVRGDSTQPGLAGATIEDTAELVEKRGGVGVPVRVDHTDAAQVEALFRRVRDEQGRLDLLVNNAWGGHDLLPASLDEQPFWEQSPAILENMLRGGALSDYITTQAAVRLLMLSQGRGLVVSTTWLTPPDDPGWIPYDTSKAAKNRLAFGMAHGLRGHNIAVVALAPGWMRTEFVLARHSPEELAGTESVEYVGRAVVALALDEGVMAKSGLVLEVGNLAREYGFTDVDGRLIPPFQPGRSSS